LAGTASGVNNAVSRVAGLLAIAVFGIVLTQGFDATLPSLMTGVPADVVRDVMAQRARLAGIQVTNDAARHAIDMAFVAGFRRVMWLSAGLALLSAVVAGLTIRGRKKGVRVI
jgi:hypothetical protein